MVFVRYYWWFLFSESLYFVVVQGKQSISLEPGGQFELSGAPLETLHQTCAEVNSHLYQVSWIHHTFIYVGICKLVAQCIFVYFLVFCFPLGPPDNYLLRMCSAPYHEIPPIFSSNCFQELWWPNKLLALAFNAVLLSNFFVFAILFALSFCCSCLYKSESP